MRFINPSALRPEIFFSSLPLWNWSINGYQVVMIIWNIFLAILSVFVSYYFLELLQKRKIEIWKKVAVGIVWLLLVPNTAYVMTDARHIIGYCPIEEYGKVCAENAWMTIFFFAYALVGWVTMVMSIVPLRQWIQKKKGKRASLDFMLVLMPLMALGVLLGLINRWNSWEVLSNPILIFKTLFVYVSDLTYVKNWFIVSILLYILYFGGEFLFTYGLFKSKQSNRSTRKG